MRAFEPPLKLIRSRLEHLLWGGLTGGPEGRAVDFSQPRGEAALVPADSVSWRVFGNPVSLLIGGTTAVLLELAEPRVRSGVWDHTTFRTDPLKRMRRTGLAAMVTVYGSRSLAEGMIAGIRRMHEKVSGTTPAGIPYRADDPELLRWVHSTAAFGFMEAYQVYVTPLDAAARDQYYAEGAPVSQLYGAADPPGSEPEMRGYFGEMRSRLEPSPIIHEFLDIMAGLPLAPGPFRFLNQSVIRASIALLPAEIRAALELDGYGKPGRLETIALRTFGRFTENLHLETSPLARARKRLRDDSR